MRSLIGRRHKTVGPVGRTSDGSPARIDHDDERGQVFVFAPETIADPGAKGWIPLGHLSRIHLDHPGAVREGVGIETLHEAKLVQALVEVRKGVRAPEPGLAVLLELSGRSEQLAPRHLATARLYVDLLPTVLLQLRLVVPGVHGRRTAVHEEEDNVLRLRGEVRHS